MPRKKTEETEETKPALPKKALKSGVHHLDADGFDESEYSTKLRNRGHLFKNGKKFVCVEVE